MPTFGQEGRRKQGTFRNASPVISDAARTPGDDVGKRNLHLLALGYEQENLYPPLRGPAGAVRFFADRKIKWWRSSRSGDSRGTDGPTRNLASSQVACVNFLLPLADIPGALTVCLQALDRDVDAVIQIEYNGLSSPVEFEWIGPEVSLEGGTQRGAQNTSVDAFAVAALKDDVRRAYLLEWKYVETYEVGGYKGEGSAGETRRTRYQDLYCAADSSFVGQVPLDEPYCAKTDPGLFSAGAELGRRPRVDCLMGFRSARVSPKSAMTSPAGHIRRAAAPGRVVDPGLRQAARR